MTKPVLIVPEITLDVEAIASALWLSPTEVAEEFRDPRLTGRLAEVWGVQMFGYQRHPNNNFPGSDAIIPVGPIGRYEIAVRAFSKHIRFQQSKYQGVGRKCSPDDLIKSLEDVEAFIAVDIREFPVVRFYPLNTKLLLRAIRNGELSPAGMKAKRFDKWIESNFDLRVQPWAGDRKEAVA